MAVGIEHQNGMLKSVQRELFKTFESQVIPWAREGAMVPILGDVPLRVPNHVRVSTLKAQTLAQSEYHRYAMNPMRWPQPGLHACRYPSLGCVLEGEADILMGVTEEMALEAKKNDLANSIQVLSLPQRSLFLFPAGVPYSDSSRAHWEREPADAAHSRILWLRVLPMGVVIQTCFSHGASHSDNAAVLVQSSQISPLTQVLMESARGLPDNSEIVTSCLLTLLLCIHQNWPLSRVLTNAASVLRGDVGLHATTEISTDKAVTVERARRYIHSNLFEPLSLPKIARNAYVSVPQLKRLFRSELDTSVMKYISRSRIEEAKSMLAETDIVVSEIGELCGYRHRTHFTRLFVREVGISPREFRRQQRFDSSVKADGKKTRS